MSTPQATNTTQQGSAAQQGSTTNTTQQSSTTCDTCTKCMTIFSQNKIRMLYDGDFVLDTFEKVALRWKDCIVCLFYDEGVESKDWAKIFAISAQRIHGPQMAACNIELSQGVARAFTEIASNGGHPYHWAGLKGYPFILVYRAGVPVGVYSGDSAVEPFVDYCVSLACRYDYFEREILRSGVQVEKNYQMGPSGFYPREDTKLRTKSYEYTNGTSLRDYKKVPISEQGSQLAQAEQQFLSQQSNSVTQQPTVQANSQQQSTTQVNPPVQQTNTEAPAEEEERFQFPPSLSSNEEVSTPQVPRESNEEL